MRHYPLIILVFIICNACSDTGNSDNENASKLLSGKWVSIGMFSSEKQLYDTIEWGINDDFEPLALETYYIIETDSGIYRHVYKIEPDSILTIEPEREISILEFEFYNDSLGKSFSYRLDTSKEYKFNPRVYGHSERIELIGSNNESSLKFLYNSTSTSQAAIVQLSNNFLTLQYDEDTTSRFAKLNLP